MYFYNFAVIIPEIFYGISLCFYIGLFSSLFKTSKKQTYNLFILSRNFSIFILLLTFLLFLNKVSTATVCFYGLFNNDFFVKFGEIFLIFSSILILFTNTKKTLSFSYEFFIMINLSLLGILVTISSFDFITLYVGIELQTLCFYCLAAFQRSSSFSTEAGLKYFILGSFSSGILLFGISLVFANFGALNFEQLISFTNNSFHNGKNFIAYAGFFFIICSFFFKLTVAPFHIWASDVYEGAPIVVSFIFSILPKISLFFIFCKISFFIFFNYTILFQYALFFFGGCSLLFGSFSAFIQKKIKRFFVFSSVVHVGYILLCLVSGTSFSILAWAYYVIVYTITSLGCWTLLTTFEKKSKELKNTFFQQLKDIKTIQYHNQPIVICFVVFLLSIAGVPPIAGFGAKVISFSSCVDAGIPVVSLFILIFATFGSFYYIKIIKTITYAYKIKHKFISIKTQNVTISKIESYVVVSSFLFLCISFIFPGIIFTVCQEIAINLV